MSRKEEEWTEDISPSPRILKMLGKIPLKHWQCLAELIDNSIDALLEAQKSNPDWLSEELGLEYYPIEVTLPNDLQLKSGVGKITVRDLGPGMTLDQLRKAVKAGFSSNNAVDSLGLFGMGFNIATAKMGNVTTVRTSRKNDDFWTCLKIDFDKMIRDRGFSAPAWTESKEDPGDHGTNIEVSSLDITNCKYFTNSSGKGVIRRTLGKVYGNIIEEKKVFIRIGENLDVVTRKHCVWSSSRQVTKGTGTTPAIIPINETLPLQAFCGNCWQWSNIPDSGIGECPFCGNEDDITERERRIRGWVGIQRFFDKEQFGIDLIRNGRVIQLGDKSLFRWENDVGETPLDYPIDGNWGGRIVGELHLDFAHVVYTKDAFDDAANWPDIVEVVRGNGPLRPRIASNHGFSPNDSPLARLFTAFRKTNPPGKTNLVPGNPTDPRSGDNSTSKRWAHDHFWEGDEEYQDDSKWWALVEAAESARRSSAGDSPAPNPEDDDEDDPSDPFGGGEGDDGDEEEEYLGEHVIGLSQSFEIRPANISPIEVNVYRDDRRRTLRELSNEPPVISEYQSSNNVRMKYHPSHPAISNYSEDILDYILLELASQFSTRTGRGSEWSVPRCYAHLKEKYREDSKLDIQTLAPMAQSVLVELREHLSESGIESSREQIPSQQLAILEQAVLRQITGGREEVDALLASGEFIRYLPNQYLVGYFQESPESVMDGNFFQVPYSELSEAGKTEALRMVVSSLNDAVDAVDRNQTSANPDKLWLMRAKASIAFLEDKRNV
tara:strand:+ start:1164 stop:3494 length:2331 start_codon:yes stop_codon:yes gene_type:complete